jgi:ABC-type lipoprotein export system ATPase subunit
MVTHDPRSAARAQRVLQLEKGKLVKDSRNFSYVTGNAGN